MQWRFPRFRQPWGQCGTCGFDVPVSKLVLTKYGWQCTGAPGANCYDSRPDRDDYLAAQKFPTNEGVRRHPAPGTNTLQEGWTEDDSAEAVDFGDGDFGSGPFGGE